MRPMPRNYKRQRTNHRRLILRRLPHLSPPRLLVPRKATCVLATTPALHPATGVRVARGMEAIGTPHSMIGSLGPIGHNARRALLRAVGK